MDSPVLVTGAGRRIGLHLVNTFREEGIEPVVHYHTRTEPVDQLERDGVTVLQGDFDHRDGILRFVERLDDNVNSLGGIIHNASMFDETEASLEEASEQYSNFFHVHMMAPYLINEGCLDLLKQSDRSPADIIMLTDMYVDRPEADIDIYGSTKAGLSNLVESGAQKYGPEIKVNGIAPGPVLFEEDAGEEYRQQVLDRTPLDREGGADSIADVVMMILENDFMTGAQIPVDGGRRLR